MGVLHFLNVGNGDCTLIQHPSGRVTVVDVCNASDPRSPANLLYHAMIKTDAAYGNYNQRSEAVNPIEYLRRFGISTVFRFIVTHPDMDHLDGIRAFFQAFQPENFWDTNNRAEKAFGSGGGFNEEDWLFYKSLRDGRGNSGSKRLTLYSGSTGPFYNRDESGNSGGDGLSVLAPTRDLVNASNLCQDYNDCSYVILYRSCGHRILLAGDSHDDTWDHILRNHSEEVRNVDLLIAPHHGRKSGRSYKFLDIVNPAITLFGNAPSEHLAYGAWRHRNLTIVTNNQAASVIVDTATMDYYATNHTFSKRVYVGSFYDETKKAYYFGRYPHSTRIAA